MNPLYPDREAQRNLLMRSTKTGVEDMITMDNLSEDVLLDNLHKRFTSDIIYVCKKQRSVRVR